MPNLALHVFVTVQVACGLTLDTKYGQPHP